MCSFLSWGFGFKVQGSKAKGFIFQLCVSDLVRGQGLWLGGFTAKALDPKPQTLLRFRISLLLGA